MTGPDHYHEAEIQAECAAGLIDEGRSDEQYITATRRRGRRWIMPNTSVSPQRGFPPGE